MNRKIRILFVLIPFLFFLSLSLKAEPVPGSAVEEKKIEEITKKVFPSVVKVEARNRIKKVATGVVIDKDGYIVTTALVSPQEEEIFVVTSDGKRIEAKFLGMDPVTHLALIQAKDKDLLPIKMGKMKEQIPGTWIGVVSISPENTPAVTQGIISSVSQVFPYNLRLNVWVLPGSSGSPVVDDEGSMVGLLRGIYTEDKPVFFEFREKELVGSGYVFSKAAAPSSGMALAVPGSVLKDVCDEIRKKGKAERGWLGVSIMEDEEGRVEIAEVGEGSPAEMAKLKKGDIILEIDGKKLTSAQMLVNEIRKRKPGESATFKIERKEKIEDVKVRLGEYSARDIKRELAVKFPQLFPPTLPELPSPPEAVRPPRVEIFPRGWESRKYIGVYLEELNEELSDYFGVEKGAGLLVSKVSEDGPTEKAGLKVGDVIVKADGKRVESVRELSELIQDKKKGDKIEIEFIRDKKKKTANVEIEEEEKSGYSYFSEDWDDYRDALRKYSESIQKQHESWQDRYGQDIEKNMKKLNKELNKIYEEASKKKDEASKRMKLFFNKYKGIRV